MNRITSRSFSIAMTALLFCASNAFSLVVDDFESYPLGSIDGQGAWNDFGGTLSPVVTDEMSFSGSHSLSCFL